MENNSLEVGDVVYMSTVGSRFLTKTKVNRVTKTQVDTEIGIRAYRLSSTTMFSLYGKRNMGSVFYKATPALDAKYHEQYRNKLLDKLYREKTGTLTLKQVNSIIEILSLETDESKDIRL